MYLPPTMLPHSLRVLVDPPIEFPEVQDAAPLISSSRWSRLLTAVRAVRGSQPAQAGTEPCADGAPPAPRSLLRRRSACTD
jgi:hypothetical protein